MQTEFLLQTHTQQQAIQKPLMKGIDDDNRDICLKFYINSVEEIPKLRSTEESANDGL